MSRNGEMLTTVSLLVSSYLIDKDKAMSTSHYNRKL